METGVVAVIILVVLVGGTLALLTRQGLVPWNLPMPRISSVGSAGPADDLVVPDRAPGLGTEAAERGTPALLAEARPVESPAMGSELGAPRFPEPLRLDLAPSLTANLEARFDQINARLDTLQRAIERQQADLGQLRAELLAKGAADDALREAAIERLRADLLAAVRGGTTERQQRITDRRSEVSADLYARLARLESALSAVTNPILLPGEAYAPPAELLTEALIWENWNEVGERAFALADAFSAQRLSLSDGARGEMGQFVTALRLLLTRSVYPNLQTDPDAAQRTALHAALEEIAAELPKIRASLDREYRDASS